ncbi:MAG: amidase [Bradymonadia bacterium]
MKAAEPTPPRDLDRPAMELAARIRAGSSTARALVDGYVDRIRGFNGEVNALAAERFEAARREADLADGQVAQARAAGPAAVEALPPLLGVPCSIKEFLAVEGMPWTGGLVRRRAVRADVDATVVARVRAAGAIVLGTTNVAEGGMWMESDNPVYGRTLNPWNPAHTAGGSSGGEAALVAAGGSAFGLASDIGGSIRFPAAFCGTFGHKPTGGLVPNTGHFPGGEDTLAPMLTTGPITRSAGDLMPLLRVLAGPDGRSSACRPYALGDPERVDWSKMTVHVLENPPARPGPHAAAAVARAADALAQRGATVRPLTLPNMRAAVLLWATRLLGQSGDEDYAVVLGDGVPIPLARELVAWALRRGNHSGPAVWIAALDRLSRKVPIPSAGALARLDALRQALDTTLGENGVLLCAPYPRPAPRHHRPLLRPLDFACCGVFNATESPATVVPAGFAPDGLPLSVQIVGAHGQDHLTIAAALALESPLGGWVRAHSSSGGSR